MIVLDTDILVELEKSNKNVIKRLAKLMEQHPENPAITSAVYAEFLFGSLTIGKGNQAIKYLEAFEVLDFDKLSARMFAALKEDLKNKGAPIPVFDLITASTVITRNAALVSSDKHFENIPGLNLVSFK